MIRGGNNNFTKYKLFYFYFTTDNESSVVFELAFEVESSTFDVAFVVVLDS